ncbi:MAG: hypothetical protein COA74_07320 [Gammaproteobacteria bacterium]|nr:MAG: hypothetical protein COA74_07320 [Gammaproteobacteria bacterium]
MTNKKDSSFLGSLLGRKKQQEPETKSANNELFACLHSLSTIGEGRDKKVDREIQTFKKMVKIGTSASDIQNQVTAITKALTNSISEDRSLLLVEQFKNMPAVILLDEFIAQPISNEIKIRLVNYKRSLLKDTLATDTISDLIDLIEPLDQQSKTESTSLNDKIFDPKVDATKLNEIAKPLLDLFSQIELTPTQTEELQSMKNRSQSMSELEELCTFIDDVCHLILSFIATSAGRFESFLTQLKQRLDTVNTCITQNNDTNQAIAQCSKTFSHCVSTQIGNIQESLSSPSGLSSLEKVVTSSLENIVDGIGRFDTERKALEDESTNRIQALQEELQKTQTETELLKENLQQQQDRALTDPLTKLPNRHAYNERLHLEYNRWRRYQKPLSLVMGDIDFFKKINDTHGHLAGDTALRETAQILLQGIRSTDFVARFGGEEFVMLLPETKIKDATKAINQIRKNVQAHTVKEGSASITLTISFGVATFEKGDTFSSVLARADKALYRAKDKGRNQVCVQMKQDN